ncbi:MAG TPA: ABC transporter permease [Acidimicrobiales bacterium]|nr:ABC transporter permease [Acidimicrobiales bacterium]
MAIETGAAGAAGAIDSRLLEEELAGLDALGLDEDQPAVRLGRLWSALWPKLAAVVLALAAWQVIVWSHWRPEYVLPSPGRVLGQLGNLLAEGEFYRAIAITLRRALTGYALAVVVGTVVGASVARIRPLRTAVGSLITGLQTMPSIAWFPLAILLFQLSESAILFVVVLGAAPSIANGLIAGVDHVPPLLQRAGRVLGASGLRLYRHVILPASLPSFVAGLKQGWAFAWRSLMAGELLVILANRPSIGARLQFARELSDAPALLSLMIVVLVIGIVVDGVFNQVDGRIRRRRGLTAGA